MKKLLVLCLLMISHLTYAADNSCSMNLRIKITTLGSGATKEELSKLSLAKIGIELNSWLTSAIRLPEGALYNPKMEAKKIFEEKGLVIDNSKKYSQELNLNLACSNDGKATTCSYSYTLPFDKELRANSITVNNTKLDFAIFETISEISKEISNCTK